jgi:flagellar protein FlgJ
MALTPLTQPASAPAAAAKPASAALSTTVQHLMGTLWDEVLTEMDKTGMNSDSLGPGGSDFQSMFLWNVAQNDFGKYDGSLAQAMIDQIGGHNAGATAGLPTATAENFDAALSQSQLSGAAVNSAVATAAAAPATNVTLAAATDFARKVWPQLTAAAQKLGIPAIGLLAQTALETGWGTAAPGNNLFGVKAVDGESGTARPTQEMQDGILVPQVASFRNYSSPGASIADYTGQIMTGFQGAMGQSSVAGFARALQAEGYATDNQYAAKIIGIAQSPMMSGVLQALGADTGVAAPINTTAPSP